MTSCVYAAVHWNVAAYFRLELSCQDTPFERHYCASFYFLRPAPVPACLDILDYQCNEKKPRKSLLRGVFSNVIADGD